MSRKPYGYIYKTNFPDGRYYIGQTKSSVIRPHYFGSGTYMLKYISTHGSKTLKTEVLEWVYGGQKQLNDIEVKHLGDKYCTDRLCVNLQPAGNQAGASDEFREKMRKINTGKKLSIETREKLSRLRSGVGNSFYGKTHSEETKAKMRAAHLKRKMATT